MFIGIIIISVLNLLPMVYPVTFSGGLYYLTWNGSVQRTGLPQERHVRITNGLYIGLPLCQAPAYLASSTHIAKIILIEAILAQLMPKSLRLLFGPILASYD
ncbi:hypothetical protein VSDG_05856 [Cytospora chrysosperma]|uniref:Uncharacterized protein n=1 Tax=Cytospora chrysosperma TaxID=252740 RepID=A0A423VVH8_CYTCH|nr:hypothetical protein VSDG_05856 [Valsa sordida]